MFGPSLPLYQSVSVPADEHAINAFASTRPTWLYSRTLRELLDITTGKDKFSNWPTHLLIPARLAECDDKTHFCLADYFVTEVSYWRADSRDYKRVVWLKYKMKPPGSIVGLRTRSLRLLKKMLPTQDASPHYWQGAVAEVGFSFSSL